MRIQFFNEFIFEWNVANAADWTKIRRIFVAAYLSTYRNRSFEELQYDNAMRQHAETIFQESADKGFDTLMSHVIKPLQFYLNHETHPLKDECAALKAHFLDPSRDISIARNTLIKLIMLQHYFEEDFDQEHQKIRGGPKKIDYLVVRFHDEPIAFFVTELNYKSGHVYLRFVTMAPAFHRLGLGNKSLDKIAQHYPDATGMELYTRKANLSARHFYENYGFKPFPFDFAEPGLERSTLHFPNDDSTNHPEAFIAYCVTKNRYASAYNSKRTTDLRKLATSNPPTTFYPYHVNSYHEGRWHACEADGTQFNLKGSPYETLKGDYLKSRILLDFKNQLKMASKETLEQQVSSMMNSEEYKVLRTGQGYTTRIFGLKTSSVIAFQKMVEERKEQLDKTVHTQSL